METELMFEYTCPECGHGMVRTTRVHNYKTKIKGYPFVVDEALIGVCDECRAESFAPEETKRWETLFSRSLEARQAFLSPEEITELRKALNLSMEDFARLIGSTRQSLSMWEKEGRYSLPLRTADLLMKLVRQSLRAGPVDVLTFLLDEAQKWGIVIELRRSPVRAKQNGGVVLHLERKQKSIVSQASSPVALAAQDSSEEEQVLATTAEGKHVGVLSYDYRRGDLILDITGALPSWKTIDAEIETQDGQRFTKNNLSTQEHRLILLEKTKLREKDIARITLKPPNRYATIIMKSTVAARIEALLRQIQLLTSAPIHWVFLPTSKTYSLAFADWSLTSRLTNGFGMNLSFPSSTGCSQAEPPEPSLFGEQVAELHQRTQQVQRINDLFFAIPNGDASVEEVANALVTFGQTDLSFIFLSSQVVWSFGRHTEDRRFAVSEDHSFFGSSSGRGGSARLSKPRIIKGL